MDIGRRTWDELEVIEDSSNRLLFRDKLRRRRKGGEFEEIPVRVRIVKPLEIVQARAECRVWCSSLEGFDADRDKDAFEQLEQICILARAIRTDKAPHSQYASKEELATQYDEGSLADILGRIQAYKQMTDPRIEVLDEHTCWRKIHEVAEVGHLLPLTDIAGHAQPSFLLFTVRQAANSQTGQSWRQSLGSSTPAQATSPTSEGSSSEQASARNFSSISPQK